MSDEPNMAESEQDLVQLIRERAYLMWEADGRPDGGAEEYWHRARERIEAETHSSYPPFQSTEHRSYGQDSFIEPKNDGCGDTDGGHEGVGTPIIASVNAPPVFQFAEHVFDLMALTIEVAVVRERVLAVHL